jgi:hypothetical protein
VIKEKVKKMFAAIWYGNIGLYAGFLTFAELCLFRWDSLRGWKLTLYEFFPFAYRLDSEVNLISYLIPSPTVISRVVLQYYAWEITP